jgi:pyrroloquinoline-quinone synthase
MSTILAYEEFVKALESARMPRGSVKHPFSQLWAEGKLSRAQLGKWATQHYYYIEVIAQQFAALYARMPDLTGRLMLLDNLVGEEMPENTDKSHPNLLLKFAEACGVSREEVREAESDSLILPTTRAMRSWVWELCSIRPLGQACAGIMVALEGQLPTLYPTYIKAMEKMGFSEDELEFFHVHVVADVEHADVGLQLAYKYSPTRAEQELAIAAVDASAGLRYSMLNGIHEALIVQQAA